MKKPGFGAMSPATLIRVVAGDTLVVKVRGFDLTVRLLDVWASETHGEKKAEGLAAKGWMVDKLPVGSELEVHVPTGHGNKVSKILTFGRVLAFVWLKGEAISLNEQIIVQAVFATREK